MKCVVVLHRAVAISADDEDSVSEGQRLFALGLSHQPLLLATVVQIRQHAQRPAWSVLELNRDPSEVVSYLPENATLHRVLRGAELQ